MSKEKEFDFTIPREKKPDYLAELVSVIVEDFDDLKISDKSKEEISRRAKEIIDQTREETIRECDEFFNNNFLNPLNKDLVEVKQSLINLRQK